MPKRVDNNEAHANRSALSEIRMNSPMPQEMRFSYCDYQLDVFGSRLLSLSLLCVVNCSFFNSVNCVPYGSEGL